MNIKKFNAAAGLILIALLIVHISYEVWSYLTFYYNPAVTRLIAWSFAGVTSIHIIMSAVSVAGKHDGSTLAKYPRMNLGTILQRGSALGILVLLPVHVKTGDWIAQHAVGNTGFIVLVILEILFWVMIGVHVTMSLSRALISLGLLENMKNKKTIDFMTGILCAAGISVSAYIIIVTQLVLLNM